MIERKKKKCNDCGELDYIFSKGRCKKCASLSYSKPKPKKQYISPISKKQASRLSEYRKVRDEFMKQHPLCQANIVKECGYYATDVHHMKGKIGEDLINAENFLAVCRQCHTYIEEHPEEAYSKGFSIKRIGI